MLTERYDWALRFGFKSSTFHTSFSTIGFLRVFEANKRPEEAERDVELVFNVPKGQRSKYEEIVKVDRGRHRLFRGPKLLHHVIFRLITSSEPY